MQQGSYFGMGVAALICKDDFLGQGCSLTDGFLGHARPSQVLQHLDDPHWQLNVAPVPLCRDFCCYFVWHCWGLGHNMGWGVPPRPFSLLGRSLLGLLLLPIKRGRKISMGETLVIARPGKSVVFLLKKYTRRWERCSLFTANLALLRLHSPGEGQKERPLWRSCFSKGERTKLDKLTTPWSSTTERAGSETTALLTKVGQTEVLFRHCSGGDRQNVHVYAIVLSTGGGGDWLRWVGRKYGNVCAVMNQAG